MAKPAEDPLNITSEIKRRRLPVTVQFVTAQPCVFILIHKLTVLQYLHTGCPDASFPRTCIMQSIRKVW